VNKVIVSGPTGCIGQAILNTAINQQIEIYAICHPDSLRNMSIPRHSLVHIIEADLSQLLSAKDMLPDDCEVFYHLGWAGCVPELRNDMDVQAANIRYTLDAVRLAQACGCHTFVGAGSQAEYGRVEGLLRPDTPAFPEIGYGMAKLCAGQMSRVLAHQLGLKHVWARILSVYGPYDSEHTMIMSAIRSLLNGQKPSFTKGEQLWDYLYSVDAAGILLALGSERSVDGAVYCVGSGQVLPLKSYIEIIRDSIDPQLPLGIGDIPYSENQVMHLCADTTAIVRDLGYSYRFDFLEGIKATIEWYKQMRGKTISETR